MDRSRKKPKTSIDDLRRVYRQGDVRIVKLGDVKGADTGAAAERQLITINVKGALKAI